MAMDCSVERPWGLHQPVRNDEECARCGWTAPGPKGDALADALEAAALADAVVPVEGWSLYRGGGGQLAA
ncbi:MAG TPA: hypothetical protein VEZ70_04900 [Allosphingosinicella sp.]|nr:hypothetical protein [Allosphingosinicella sp.]